MAAPPAGPVADFCAELHRLVRKCRVPQREIADALGLRSVSSVSDLLNGRRRTVPDWGAVRKIVGLCARRNGNGAPPPGMSLDVTWWKSRHAELERTAETTHERAAGSGRSATVPADAGTAERARTQPAPPPEPELDVMACVDMGVDQAVRLLARGRAELRGAADALMTPFAGEEEASGVLRDLLSHFPARVRAARGLGRAALIQAARVVLVAAAVRGSGHTAAAQGLILDLAYGSHVTHTSPLADVAGTVPGTIPTDTAALITDRYVRLAAPLAASCPEFTLAAGLPGVEVHGPATTGLAGLGNLLSTFAGPDAGLAPRGDLLRDPIASLDSPGVRLPSLAEGYIAPRFRLAAASRGLDAGIASDKWWGEQPAYDDIERFLAAHCLGLPGLLAPLIVLGHPGSGKSLLTKLLTARLPAGEFRPLRVELRHTPADVGVQGQLEHAVERETGRAVSWPEWSEEEPGPVPVVLLDGFDELLQASAQGLGRRHLWNYLQEVKDFQKREARLGRPLIVIVTSRTVVADRAAVPTGSQVIRLEPFEEPEIRCWIGVWNTTNAGYFERHGVSAFTREAVRPHRDLAAQPLLLLMLALYDGIDNALQRSRHTEISRTELYDRLLREFVRRQVGKDGPLPPAETADAVDRELHRLSAVALCMFHRGAQAISGEEAGRALRALGASEPDGADDGSGLLFGRFFFVHEAQAIVAEEPLRTYEFMHATFGEHLAARLIKSALDRLLTCDTPVDDGELYALLCYAPLTDRAQLVQNLRDMMATSPRDRVRAVLMPRLGDLFRGAAWDPEHRTASRYAPVRLRRAYRDAVYEANLVLLMVLAAGEVYASDFVEAGSDTADVWRRHALGWKAQLSDESWAALTSTLHPERCRRPHSEKPGETYRDLCVSTRRPQLADHDLSWWFWPAPPAAARPLSDGLENRFSPSASGVPDLIRRASFVGDEETDLLLHIGHPVLLQLPSAMDMHTGSHNSVRSAAQSLVALLTRDVYAPGVLPRLYRECLTHAAALGPDEYGPYLEAVLCHLAHDVPDLPDEELAWVLSELPRSLIETPVPLTESVERALFSCVHHALDRGSPHLTSPLNGIRTALVGDDRTALQDLLAMTHLSDSTRAWLWSGSPRGKTAAHHFSALLEGLDLPAVAVTHPSALIGLLRLAAELGLDDWLALHTPTILAALPAEAFGLFRPSDLPHLRAALPRGAYAEQLEEVEWTWRGPEPTAL